jgi:hypothetical protein
LEIIVGAAAMWLALVGLHEFHGTQTVTLNNFLTIIAGVYVIIRGLDNIEQGMKSRNSAFLPL